MGAKTWMLATAEKSPRDALSSRPKIDRESSLHLAQKLFPGEVHTPLEDGNLYYTNPPDDELLVGCFDGVHVLAAGEFGIDNPSQLDRKFIADTGNTTLHAMHSVVDWFAFAHWVDGKLTRALSLSPDSGVIEDIGEHLEFEKAYWAGEHPAVDDDDEIEYPFVFHPLDLGEAALLHFFGYQIEGYVADNLFDPEEIHLLRFKRTFAQSGKPWWRFW